MIPIALLALADLVLIADAFSHSPNLGNWFVPLHLGLTVAALLVSRAHVRTSGWDSLAVPLGAAIGPCAMVLIYLVKPWSFFAAPNESSASRSSSPSSSSSSSPSYLFPCGRKPKLSDPVTPMAVLARMLDRRVTFPAAEQIESLGTILRVGNLAARRKALETAVRSFEPRLSPLIASALRDDDQTIRALAAAASAQVSHNLIQQLDELGASNASFDTLYARAILLYDHGCHNVLLPRTLRAKHRRAAFEDLQECRRTALADDHRVGAIVDALGTLGVELAAAHCGKPRLVHLQELPASHGG